MYMYMVHGTYGSWPCRVQLLRWSLDQSSSKENFFIIEKVVFTPFEVCSRFSQVEWRRIEASLQCLQFTFLRLNGGVLRPAFSVCNSPFSGWIEAYWGQPSVFAINLSQVELRLIEASLQCLQFTFLRLNWGLLRPAFSVCNSPFSGWIEAYWGQPSVFAIHLSQVEWRRIEASLQCSQFAFLRWWHFQEHTTYIWTRDFKGLELHVCNFQVVVNRPYFSRPRKYRRLFSEPTYWPRRSRGQYGEGNNQAGTFEAEGNKSLIPGRLLRSPLTCPSTQKMRDESVVSLCSERYNASTGSPWPSGPKWFDRLFSTCNRQLADSPGG